MFGKEIVQGGEQLSVRWLERVNVVNFAVRPIGEQRVAARAALRAGMTYVPGSSPKRARALGRSEC